MNSLSSYKIIIAPNAHNKLSGSGILKATYKQFEPEHPTIFNMKMNAFQLI